MKKKKITAKMIKAANDASVFNYKVNLFGEEIEVTIRKVISSSEMIGFVKSVFDAATIDGVYYDALFEYSYRLHLLSYLTNLEFPDDLTGTEAFVFGAFSEIIEKGYWDHGEYFDAERALCEACEREREKRIKLQTENETPVGILIHELVDRLYNVSNGIVEGLSDEEVDLIKNIFGAAGNVNAVSPADVAAGVAALENSRENSGDEK